MKNRTLSSVVLVSMLMCPQMAMAADQDQTADRSWKEIGQEYAQWGKELGQDYAQAGKDLAQDYVDEYKEVGQEYAQWGKE